MSSFQKILLFILLFNAIYSLMKLTEDGKPLKLTVSFKTFDTIMSHSEFNKVWETVRTKIKNEEINPELQEEFENIKPDELKKDENYEYSGIDEPLLGSSESESCLVSEEETTKILEKKYDIYGKEVKEEIRFIVGKCHPVLLIPGMLSTKLQVRINCKKLSNDEPDIFKKIRFYCGQEVCKFNPEYEEHDLFISGLGAFQLSVLGDVNKYSACVGYFLTFFNTKDACSPDQDQGYDKYVCNYSPNIKIGYYGSNKASRNDGQCGLKAIHDVIMAGLPNVEKSINKGLLRSFGPLIEGLIQKGYKPGFSLGGIPNDYRKFISTNVFTTNAIRYQIENLYRNTGKTVVIIGHSFGTLTMYSNLIKEENKDLLSKIKKFIAVGPPIAGSSTLIPKVFNSDSQYKMEIDLYGNKILVEFNDFGYRMLSNTIPLVTELRPLPIIGKILNDNYEYKDFGEAVKERIFLEKECGNRLCSQEYINQYSEKFDKIFKGYFPSLTDDVCQFESSLDKSTNYFTRKCIHEMYDLADCPVIIEEKRNSNGDLPTDFEKYCRKTGDNLYYQQECGVNNGRKCLDEVYYTRNKYPFETTNEKAQFFLNNWKNNNFNLQYGESDFSEYPSREQFLSVPRKQIDYYNQISIHKDLPVPNFDVDLVYSNYDSTPVAFIYDEKDYGNGNIELSKGGDGTVPNWSPIITGLKWIYDVKKQNLRNKIRLVEFCSRLGKDSEYAFDPNKDQNFAALSCQCINNNNLYENGSNCSHGLMISDPHFFNYIDSNINDPREREYITQDRINAVYYFDNKKDYEKECNEELIKLFESDS